MAIDTGKFKRASIIVYAVGLTLFTGWWILFPPPGRSAGELTTVELSRGPYKVLNFPSKRWSTDAVVLMGSGDGGWGTVEEAIARALQQRGIEVIGIDCASYAQTDYNLTILQSDYNLIAQSSDAFQAKTKPPLIIGGYSMGAAQAIAASGGPHPPAGLVGVALIDPLSRGRYGLRISDRLNVTPTGPGTFGVSDFSSRMGSLRVVQWHASQDSIDSREWLQWIRGPHEEKIFAGTDHNYGHDLAEFARQFVLSVDWILKPPEDEASKSSRVGGNP